MDWNNARIVLAIHRGGSLTAAGKLLDLDQSTVGRRLAAFEDEIRARLFERRDLRMVATREGEIVISHAERMEAEAFSIETQVRGRDDRPEGEVVVTAVEALFEHVLIPNLPALQAKYPRIRPKLLVLNQNVSLERREADVAVRLARPTEGRALARRIGRFAYRLHAHRDLIRRAGTDDPARLPWIGYSPAEPQYEDAAWVEKQYPDAQMILEVNSAKSRAVAVRCGLGVAVVPTVFVNDMPEIVSLSGEDPAVWREVWMLTLPEYRQQARVSPVLDWITTTFEQSAALLSGRLPNSAPGRWPRQAPAEA